MIELHGWVTIRETYKITFEEDNDNTFIDKNRKEIENLSYFKPQIKALNGECFLEFTIFANRKNSETEEVFQLYNQIFSLSKGSIKEFSDFYLSPVIPTIEDAENIR